MIYAEDARVVSQSLEQLMKIMEAFDDWRGRGCSKFVSVLGGDGTKIAPLGDLFDQPSGEMSSIRGKLADHAGDHVVLSPEGAVLVPSPVTESSCPRPP